jgi:nucleotide-binding universal stress UspA family protein
VDFSDHSRRALEYAAALSAYVGGRLIVAHIVDPLLAAAQRTYQWDPLGADTREELESFTRPAIEAAGLPRSSADLVLEQGHAAPEILRLARTHEADLIVMGTHGLSGFRRALYGSTTARVLRGADRPVLAVPLPDQGQSPPNLHWFAGGVVAALDFSDTSRRAAALGARLARSFSQPLILVHVVAPLLATGRWRAEAAAQDDVRATEARATLAKVAAEVDGSDAEQLVAIGDPAEELARVASERRASLIVMGLQGSGLPLVGRAPGSVAMHTLAHSPVPVLAVPAPH